MENQVEIWKSHPYIDKIEVSSFGRVRSVKGHYYKNWRSRGGYFYVSFSIDGKITSKSVHRLVAQTFIDNPDNLPQVNHKDCDRTNNNVENLEWCTASYNSEYREKFGMPNIETLGKPVLAISLDTHEVSRYQSQVEASRMLGVSQGNISSVIKGKLKHTGGFWFVRDDGHAVDIVKQNFHDIGKTGLKIKLRV